MVKRKDDMALNEEALAGQLPEYVEAEPQAEVHVPDKISSKILNRNQVDEESFEEFERKAGTTKLGENIFKNAEARSGWIPIDRQLLGERNRYYPEDWQFLVRPATVEVVRNWSMLDETNGNSIDDVFNEILKHCLQIKTSFGLQPWQAINNWDRFFFVLVIREYTFVKGENNIEFFEDCPSCETPVKFTLESQALMYDLPDDEVLQYFDQMNRTWVIDPADFGIPAEHAINLYVPTVEKDANIKSWLISEYQENDKKKFDNVFIKFLPWLCPKISKDLGMARTQIKKAEMQFKSWDAEMFSFMNDVLKNISVTPSTNISAICEACGEEAVTRLRFPNGIGALFNVVNRRTKFGTK
jgi:hypothetical protein